MLDAVLATYLVKLIDMVMRGPANMILGKIGKLDAPSTACLRRSFRTELSVKI